MKPTKADVIWLVCTVGILIFCAGIARAELPQWYQACFPDRHDFAKWDQCLEDQGMVPKVVFPQCAGIFNAECLYEAMAALHPPWKAPDGYDWKLHYYAVDEARRHLEACLACYKTSRNRRACRC